DESSENRELELEKDNIKEIVDRSLEVVVEKDKVAAFNRDQTPE
ncbi:3465_t:CDS:1, partial [Dentiscutata erythropus]